MKKPYLTTIYMVAVDDALEGEIACETLAEAKRIRRACEEGHGGITRIRVRRQPLRSLLCAVFNREGFAEDMQILAPPKAETMTSGERLRDMGIEPLGIEIKQRGGTFDESD